MKFYVPHCMQQCHMLMMIIYRQIKIKIGTIRFYMIYHLALKLGYSDQTYIYTGLLQTLSLLKD